MATWVVHFRIADYFLDKLNVAQSEFVIGNVAPDCGYGEKDSMGKFDPPPKTTHWSPSGMKRDCRYTDFYNQYLKDGDKSDPDYSFYLGYYVHLLTDIMWSKSIYMPLREKYLEAFESEIVFLKTIKRDWNDLDFEFLNNNPDYRPYKILCENKRVKDYLPYYEPEQLTVQTKFIADFYKSERDFDREHKYLTANEVSEFIKNACEAIERDIMNNNLAQFKK